MTVRVGSPSYFAKRPKPKKPQDLTAHDCVNIRLPTYGGVYPWEFEKRGRALRVRVEGEPRRKSLLRFNRVFVSAGS